MAIQHMDNWSPYGLGGQARLIDGVFSAYEGAFIPTIVDSPDPNAPAGDLALLCQANPSGLSTNGVRYVLSTPQSKVGILARFWLDNLPSNLDQIPVVASYKSAANVQIMCAVITPTGGISVRSGEPNGTELAATSGPVVTSNAFWHIETWVTFSGGGASIEIRVEGISVLSASLPSIVVANCAMAAVASARSSSFAGSPIRTYVKDLIIADGSGTYNNDFIGSAVVLSLVPNSDVAANWTRATGTTNYSNVDNSPPLDATEYVTAIFPPPAADQYGLTDLPEDVTSVKGVMTFARARKTDGGDGNLQISLVSNAVVGNGADRPITAAFTYWRDLFETDPNTGAPFIPAAVDDLEVRMNRTV